MTNIDDHIKKIAEDHVDWIIKILRPLLITEFKHGFKHGYEFKERFNGVIGDHIQPIPKNKTDSL